MDTDQFIYIAATWLMNDMISYIHVSVMPLNTKAAPVLFFAIKRYLAVSGW